MKNSKTLSRLVNSHHIVINEEVVQVNFVYSSPEKNLYTRIHEGELDLTSSKSSLILLEGHIRSEEKPTSMNHKSNSFYKKSHR